ncbi:13684_t:CDS:10 [Acaulospora colombiana]|uniref:13684_t:CDS:1 n=1 Tax=Acaulospora colombiana TaxID=27376 RepID=A0ACA9L8S0_9GLOM|nr:13684_t:CDS:10 [Acaulospora colombiana]
MTFYEILFFYIIFWTAVVSPTPILNRRYTPKTNIFDLTIEKVTLSPDGFTRQLSTINGQYPGPTLEVNKGDRIVMRVNNQLGEPTGNLQRIFSNVLFVVRVSKRILQIEILAIHAHGMLQRGTPWFDGVPWMAQCVIPNNFEFTYNFTVPDQVGTHWYHAHETMQYVDGAFGALIIHDPDDPYKSEYDEEIIVMLNDYHHTNAQILLKQFLTPESQGVEAPPGSKCVDNAGLAKFEFVKDKKYRLRIINTSAFSAFFFSIDKHEMEVIEVEGLYTKRTKIHRLPINVAQRYSVIVTANQPTDNYIMRSEFQKKCMPDAASSLPIIKAIVHYEGAPDDSEPNDYPWSDSLTECVDLDQKTLQPLEVEKIPESTKKLKLDIAFHKNDTGVVKAFLNGSTYIPDINFPTLDKLFKHSPINETSANAYVFDKDGEVVDIYFINADDDEHPFHIHGYQFWVLGTGNGAKWHLESGLLMQLITLPDEILKMKPPKEWTELCELGER